METDEFAVTRNGAEELEVLGEGMTLDEVAREEDAADEDDEVERLKDVALRLKMGDVSPALIGLVAVVFLDTVAVGKLKEILLPPAVTAVVDAVPRADDVDVSNDILADIVVDDELRLGPEVDIPRSMELKDRSEARAAKGDAAVVETVRNEEVELSIVELPLVFGRTTGIISIVVGNDEMLLVVFWNGAACLNELIS